jgi:hypothetical protein
MNGRNVIRFADIVRRIITMALTIGNWIMVGIIVIVGIIIAFFVSDEHKYGAIATIIITILLVICTIIGFNWYHTNLASGVRNYKDYKSEMENGIEREILITAEDGREIFYYEGKVDIESNHEDNYIKFEGEDGRRYMIYYGIQDTIQIIEK